MTSGYLQGEVQSLSTDQKITQLRAADIESSGLASSVISPTEGIGQNLPEASSEAAQSATSVPSFTFTQSGILAGVAASNTSVEAAASSQSAVSTINLGASGTLTVQASRFEIQYSDVSGVKRLFAFSLLPAIENNLRSSHVGATVPEVKPGILVRTSMNYKRFSLPGGPPVYQSLGIEQSIMQLTGLLIGTEGDKYSSPDGAIYGWLGNKLKFPSAHQTAQQFDRSIVQSGREVTLLISTEGSDTMNALSLTYRALIQNFRVFIARYDRVYYAIDALLLDFNTQRIAAIATPTAAAANLTVSDVAGLAQDLSGSDEEALDRYLRSTTPTAQQQTVSRPTTPPSSATAKDESD